MKVPFVGEITGVLEDNWTAGGTWTLERIDGDCRELIGWAGWIYPMKVKEFTLKGFTPEDVAYLSLLAIAPKYEKKGYGSGGSLIMPLKSFERNKLNLSLRVFLTQILICLGSIDTISQARCEDKCGILWNLGQHRICESVAFDVSAKRE